MRAWLVVPVAAITLIAASCGGEETAFVTVTETLTITEETTVTVEADGSTQEIEATGPPASGAFPRLVGLDQVVLPDYAIEEMNEGSPFPDQAIEWAPGIYTRAARPIGALEDYSIIYGPCPEAKRFLGDRPLSLLCTT